MKAVVWRFLMAIGMKIHQFASPHPPKPSFVVKIPSRISSKRGKFKLIFYVPKEYNTAPPEQRFPLVLNFHGGGFTLGTGTDDARWARAVTENAKAVFVSVEYRLAPEYPFSVGVEDGTDALLYLAAHAEELRLDPHRIALSGFSAGGNYALTIPLMLYDLQQHAGKRTFPYNPNSSTSALSSSSKLSLLSTDVVAGPSNAGSTLSLPMKSLPPTQLELSDTLPALTLRALCAFYPPTDFRIPRSEKRTNHSRPDLNLPPVLTNLFDDSYLSPPHNDHHNPSHNHGALDLSDPYLSPAAASDALLAAAYPDNIILYTCEYDMLNQEGTQFGLRLSSREIGKSVSGGLIYGVPHAFDRKPNPLTFSKAATKCYAEACAELNAAFGRRESIESRRQLDEEEDVVRFDDDDLEHASPVGRI